MLLRVVVLAQRTLTLGQVQADAECAPQGAPLTVHIFPQEGAELAGPSLKRQCNDGGSAVSGVSGSSSAASCLAFYVRMADHPGKFDIEAAKSFALVPRLHYAALKRGESVVASAHLTPCIRSIASFSSAADGVEVQACQVVAAPIPGKSFAIVDHNGLACPVFSESACARALKLQPDTVLHFSATMTPQIEHAIAQCGRAVHVGVWGAAVEMSTMCAGMTFAHALAAAAV